MFGESFMGFGGFERDFNTGRAPDGRLPELGSGGFLPNLDTDPFLKNQCYNTKCGSSLDLCKNLSKMGISCDMSIWGERDSFRVDPRDFGSRTLHGFDQNPRNVSSGFRNVSSGFPQNSSRGVLVGDRDGGKLRLLGLHDFPSPMGFREMMALHDNPRDFLLEHVNRPLKRSSLGNEGSSMFGGNRISRALAAMEGPGEHGASAYLMGQASSYPKSTSGLPLSLASMVKIYGSVYLMAKDQIGCRVLQKLVEEGTFVDAKVIFHEIIDHVIELSIDPFGNYFVQKLLDVCDEEQRTLMVSVLTSRPMQLIKISLNTYGTRVVQKMIETVETKQQMALLKSGLKPGFLSLVKDLNGNHVIQSCLQSLDHNDHKFVLDAATRYCAEIATHRHGCCVLQCCVSYSVGAQRERLVAEISRNSLHLSQDPYGNYVVQYLIEQRVAAVKLLAQFRTHYAELATQKFSSHVVEKCLRFYPESRAEIVRELLSIPHFEHLLQDPFANYVIQTALSVAKGAVRARLVEKVYRCEQLRSSPYCKKIFAKTMLKK